MTSTDFRAWPDLARRDLGGSVLWANDELFAAADNLINPGPSEHDRASFGVRGKVYDGWETRRRRPGAERGSGPVPAGQDDFDEVIVRLGVAGVITGVVIDTAYFVGNFPASAVVEGATLLGPVSLEEVRAAEWITLLEQSDLEGDTPNTFVVSCPDRLITHVRLKIYPDGGVARFRVHGEAIADPRFLGGRIDVAATVHGGRITGCSNMFYSSPSNVLAPGVARVMSDGWETARRRGAGNDWITVALAGPAIAHHVELDTSRFVGNAPGWIALSDAVTGAQLLPMTAVQPDLLHRFRLSNSEPVSELRMDAYPDGGLSRLRLLATITDAGQAELSRRWLELLPPPLRNSVNDAEFFD